MFLPPDKRSEIASILQKIGFSNKATGKITTLLAALPKDQEKCESDLDGVLDLVQETAAK